MEPLALLVLRITQRCNLACRYCYAAWEGDTEKADMTAEMAIRAVEEACPPGGTLKIQFTGGEPLLNLPVMEAVWQYGQESGRHLRLAVQTNGTLLTPQTLKALGRMKCALGVSLDGNGDANGLRVFPDGKPAFSSAIEGIREVARAGMRCNLTAVVSDVSAPHLGGLLELALWLGCVGGVGLDLFRPMGRGAVQDHAPSAEQLDAGLRALLDQHTLLRGLGVPLVLKELERIRRLQENPGQEAAYCYAQTERSLAVDPAGRLYPCSSFIGQEDYLLGILGQESDRAGAVRSRLKAPGPCQECGHSVLCRGGCPAGRIGTAGCRNDLDCRMHQIMMEYCAGMEG